MAGGAGRQRQSMIDRVHEHEYEDEQGNRTGGPPLTPLLHKLLTVSIHLSFIALHLTGLHQAPLAMGIISVNVSVAHYALLLGVWGPKPGAGGFWWSPSPVHEPFAVMGLLTLGMADYVGLGVISYGQTDASACSDGMNALYLYTRNSTRPDTPVAEASRHVTVV